MPHLMNTIAFNGICSAFSLGWHLSNLKVCIAFIVIINNMQLISICIKGYSDLYTCSMIALHLSESDLYSYFPLHVVHVFLS